MQTIDYLNSVEGHIPQTGKRTIQFLQIDNLSRDRLVNWTSAGALVALVTTGEQLWLFESAAASAFTIYNSIKSLHMYEPTGTVVTEIYYW